MRSIILTSLMLTLAACGADVATATATTAKRQAEQAKQAKETAAQLTQKLDANIKAGEQRSAEPVEEKR
jgi:hypothetical protein